MRIGALSETAGLPISTLKYYIREGLLPPGTRTATNQADYGQAHLERIRLIRALVDVGGLSTAQVKDVLAAVDDESVPIFDAVAVSQEALITRPKDDVSRGFAAARSWVDKFIERHDFRVRADAAVRDSLAGTLAQMVDYGLADLSDPDHSGEQYFDTIAQFFRDLSAVEDDLVPDLSRAETVTVLLVGIVLTDAAIIDVRRIAAEDASQRRYDES